MTWFVVARSTGARRRSPVGRRLGVLVVAFVGAVTAAGCSSSASSTSTTLGLRAASLTVVATTTQIADFVNNVGGPDVKVYSVLQANVDPHDYEPTAADLDAIATADVIVKNGVGLERWFDSTIKSAAPKGIVVDASTGVSIRGAQPGEKGDTGGDPHIWLNPQNVKLMVGNIEAALEKADPQHAAGYQQRLADYRAKLDALDISITARIRDLPSKKIVTNHDAFGYYIDHYGLKYVGAVFPSFDTQSELSPTDVTDLVAKIKAERVKVVFAESSLPPKAAAAIADEAGVKVVDGADALYGDTLGEPGSDGDTYLKMMEHDTNTIVTNLDPTKAQAQG